MYMFGRPVNSCMRAASANEALQELSVYDSTHITHKVALCVGRVRIGLSLHKALILKGAN